MASGDTKGRLRTIGKKKWAEIQEKQKIIADKLEHGVNLQVGDFISELATAISHKERVGLTEGDWIEEPERLFTDGQVFGEEVRVAAHVRIQVAVCIDTSCSMYNNNIMANAGRAMIALDQYLRKAQAELPEGCLTYANFAWAMGRRGDKSYKIRDSTLKNFEGVHALIHNTGANTRIAPLFETIEGWENAYGDPNAHRLDLVITDGVLEHKDDVEEATRVQERRNGRLSTILLNFLPREEWGRYHLPGRCFQYPVTHDTLTTTLRTCISEAISEMV